MKGFTLIGTTVVVLLAVAMFVGAGWDHPPTESVQRGYRGTGMDLILNPRTEAAKRVATGPIPEEPWPLELPTDPEDRADKLYENVQVLGDLGGDQFSRLMQAITNWVSPEQGCAYCHNEENYADDGLYTKVVARRMLQMTRHINADYKSHVAGVGVTCYTCHRGKNVPEYVWFKGVPGDPHGMVGNSAGQNHPDTVAGLASLPADPFSPFLLDNRSIRVAANTPLPTGDRNSIKRTEWTYSLMIHFSQSLGVNCTYCHNSRAFANWQQSSPQRVIAWHGIDMVRSLNNDYLNPLNAQYPAKRLGPTGDAPKANCATCHQGAYKPLYGAAMAKDYPSLLGVDARMPGKAAAAEAPATAPTVANAN